MKVLLATGLYPPDIGGPATHAKMIADELPKAAIPVEVVPFSLVRERSKWVRHLAYGLLLWRAAKKADVIYTLDPVSAGFPAAIVAKLRRKPLILRLGGDYAWEQGRERFGVTQHLDDFVRSQQPSRMVRILQRVQTWVANRSEAVVVPSEYLKTIIEQWGIDIDKIYVIHSVLYPLQIDLTKHEAKLSLQASSPMLFSAGRLVPWKGFETLLDVVTDLQNEFPELHLYIAGDGSQRQLLEDKLQSKGLSRQVTLLGRLDKAALALYKRAADVFVLNTAYEGLSHELLEAMSLGTPIVSTNVGGNPEVVTNERDGLLVSYNDTLALSSAIKRLLSNEALRTRLVQAARVRTQDFSKEKAITQIVRLIKSVHERNI